MRGFQVWTAAVAATIALPVAVATADPVTLSTAGERPDVAVSADGTGHVAWNEPDGSATDTTHHCTLPVGAAACTPVALPPPATGANSNTEDAHPYVFLPDATHELLLDGRCCTATAAVLKAVYRSNDGGQSFAGPSTVATDTALGGGMSGQALDLPAGTVTGLTGEAVATINGQSGYGAEVQVASTTASTSAFFRISSGATYAASVAAAGGKLVAAFAAQGGTLAWRAYKGVGDPNADADWTAAQTIDTGIDTSRAVDLAGGPSGIWILYAKADAPGHSAYVVRHQEPGGWSTPVTVTGAPQPSANIYRAYFFQDPAGGLHVVWQDENDDLLHRFTTDASHTTWSDTRTIDGPGSGLHNFLRAATDADGNGWVVWDTGAAVLAAPLTGIVPAASPPPAPLAPPPHTSFTVSPDHTPEIAGSPLTFHADGDARLQYEWDFDEAPGAPFSAQATGQDVVHAFPDPGGRRTFHVVLRVGGDGGPQAARDITVLPDTAPRVDFDVTPSGDSAERPVTFVPVAEDPDAEAGAPDRIVQEQWDLDGDGKPDLTCVPGQTCTPTRTPSTPDRPWLTDAGTAPVQISPGLAAFHRPPTVVTPHAGFDAFAVDFTDLGLAQAGLSPLFALGFPTGKDTLAAPTGRARLVFWGNAVKLASVDYDPDAARLYETSSLLENSSFEQDVVHGASRGPRMVTLWATDGEGRTSAVTHAVTLRPPQTPVVNAQFVNDGTLFAPQLSHSKDTPQTQRVQYPITPNTPVAFTPDISDADSRIEGYVVEAGTPFGFMGLCQKPSRPGLVGVNQQIVANPGVAAGDPAPELNGAQQQAGMASRARPRTAIAVPPARGLGALLADRPYVHPCGQFVARNVRGDTLTQPPLTKLTTDAHQLGFTFPAVGDYSVSIAAYDDHGLGAIERIDGFHVVAAEGTCQNVSGERFGDRGFGGACVSWSHDRRLYWVRGEMDVDGLTLKPDAGGFLVDTVHHCLVATTATIDLRADRDQCAGADAKAVGVDVVVGVDPVARFARFDRTTADAFITNHRQASVIRGAQYKGFDVDTAQPRLQVHFDSSTSRTHFLVDQPGAFGDGSGARPTAPIDVTGRDEPTTSVLETNRFATTARHRRHRGPTATIAGFGQQSLDLPPTQIGPISVGGGDLTYDPVSGVFSATVNATLPIGISAVGADLHLELRDGELLEADATVTIPGGIPVFTDVFLDQIRVKISTHPTTLLGGVHLTTLPSVIEADADLAITPDVPEVRVEGDVKVKGIELGSAFVDYRDGTLTLGAHIGKDFGPAALDVDIRGGLDLPDFYLEGDGRACLWVCLGVKALVSNIAIAACGDIDLGITDISGGFAYRWGDGFESFQGCDLSRYVPAGLQSRAALRAGGTTTVTVPPGLPSVAIKAVAQPGVAAAPRVTITGPGGDARVITTPQAPGAAGFTPAPVDLTGAKGTTTEGTALVVQEPQTSGAGEHGIGTVPASTTAIVARPRAGTWTVRIDAGQPDLARVDLAYGLQPLRPSALAGTVHVGPRAAATAAAAAHRAAITPAARIAPVERRRLESAVLSLRAATVGAGKVTLIDAGAQTQKILGTFDASKAARHGVPVTFDPSSERGAHTLEAFVTQPDGTPRGLVAVDRFTPPAPSAPTPRGLSLERSRFGLSLSFDAGGVPLGNDQTLVRLLVTDDRGQRIEHTAIGRGIAALPGGRVRVALGPLTHGDRVRVTVRTVYAGDTSAPASIGGTA